MANIPNRTGRRITVSTDLNIARNDTSIHLCAKAYTKVGVTIGDINVDVINKLAGLGKIISAKAQLFKA